MSAHENCKHQSTKKARANCRRVRDLVASYTPLTREEISTAMRHGTAVTGWNIFDGSALEEGVVIREHTGTLDDVRKGDDGTEYFVIAFQIDPTGKTCSPALYSASTHRLGQIRLAK